MGQLNFYRLWRRIIKSLILFVDYHCALIHMYRLYDVYVCFNILAVYANIWTCNTPFNRASLADFRTIECFRWFTAVKRLLIRRRYAAGRIYTIGCYWFAAAMLLGESIQLAVILIIDSPQLCCWANLYNWLLFLLLLLLLLLLLIFLPTFFEGALLREIANPHLWKFQILLTRSLPAHFRI